MKKISNRQAAKIIDQIFDDPDTSNRDARLKQLTASMFPSSGTKPSGIAQPRAKTTSEAICSMIFLALCGIQEQGRLDTAHLRDKVTLLKPEALELLITSLTQLRHQA